MYFYAGVTDPRSCSKRMQFDGDKDTVICKRRKKKKYCTAAELYVHVYLWSDKVQAILLVQVAAIISSKSRT